VDSGPGGEPAESVYGRRLVFYGEGKLCAGAGSVRELFQSVDKSVSQQEQ